MDPSSGEGPSSGSTSGSNASSGSKSGRLARNVAEKQRRDKLNSYISELGNVVPLVSSSNKRLDKTSILRLSAAYLRLVQSPLKGVAYKQRCNENLMVSLPSGQGGDGSSYIPSTRDDDGTSSLRARRKRPFMSQLLPSNLVSYVNEDMDGFLVVTNCDQVILYASESCEHFLGHQNIDLMGFTLDSFVHPTEVNYINEGWEREKSKFLSGFRSKGDLIQFRCKMRERSQPRTEVITFQMVLISGRFHYDLSDLGCDAATLEERVRDILQHQPLSPPIPSPCPSSASTSANRIDVTLNKIERRRESTGKKFNPSICKSPSPPSDVNSLNRNSLMKSILFKGFVRVIASNPLVDLSLSDSNQNEYVSRFSLDGVMLYADHRISMVAGYLPDEVMGKSAYGFIHRNDHVISLFAHKMMMSNSNGTGLIVHRLRCRDGGWVHVESSGCLQYDRSTGQVDHFICVTRLLPTEKGNHEREKFIKKFTPHISNNSPSFLYESLQLVIGPRSGTSGPNQPLVITDKAHGSPGSHLQQDEVTGKVTSFVRPASIPSYDYTSILMEAAASSDPETGQSSSPSPTGMMMRSSTSNLAPEYDANCSLPLMTPTSPPPMGPTFHVDSSSTSYPAQNDILRNVTKYIPRRGDHPFQSDAGYVVHSATRNQVHFIMQDSGMTSMAMDEVTYNPEVDSHVMFPASGDEASQWEASGGNFYGFSPKKEPDDDAQYNAIDTTQTNQLNTRNNQQLNYNNNNQSNKLDDRHQFLPHSDPTSPSPSPSLGYTNEGDLMDPPSLIHASSTYQIGNHSSVRHHPFQRHNSRMNQPSPSMGCNPRGQHHPYRNGMGNGNGTSSSASHSPSSSYQLLHESINQMKAALVPEQMACAMANEAQSCSMTMFNPGANVPQQNPNLPLHHHHHHAPALSLPFSASGDAMTTKCDPIDRTTTLHMTTNDTITQPIELLVPGTSFLPSDPNLAIHQTNNIPLGSIHHHQFHSLSQSLQPDLTSSSMAHLNHPYAPQQPPPSHPHLP